MDSSMENMSNCATEGGSQAAWKCEFWDIRNISQFFFYFLEKILQEPKSFPKKKEILNMIIAYENKIKTQHECEFVISVNEHTFWKITEDSRDELS